MIANACVLTFVLTSLASSSFSSTSCLCFACPPDSLSSGLPGDAGRTHSRRNGSALGRGQLSYSWSEE